LLATPAEGDAQGVQHALLGENPSPVIQDVTAQLDTPQAYPAGVLGAGIV
jgi:hypothetical protein